MTDAEAKAIKAKVLVTTARTTIYHAEASRLQEVDGNGEGSLDSKSTKGPSTASREGATHR